MRVILAGGSGFLGRTLAGALAAAGHRVQILTRQPASPGGTPGQDHERITWAPDGTASGPWAAACAGADVVINLAGESIAAGRWSPARKQALRDSRVLATRSLAQLFARAPKPPAALISSSAIGYYGDRGGETLTEDSGPGSGFLADLGVEWEREALAADRTGARVVLLRTGIVLDPREGALAKMVPPFRMFAGGPFGSGRQYMSWIHRSDWVSLATWALDTPAVRGALNLTAPNPVTNADFARALGRALRRPALVPAPAFALKLVLGEMAGPLLLHSQRVMPARAIDGGFRFAHPDLDDALADLLASSYAFNTPPAP